MDRRLVAVLRAATAGALFAVSAPMEAHAAQPVHGGHYVAATSQVWLDGLHPEGVIHVARDGRSLVAHSGINVSADCYGTGFMDEIRIDGTPVVKVSAAGVVSYHVTRFTLDGVDLIDLEGVFVTRRHFEGVLHVHFGGTPTSGPPCPTPWIRVSAWYARHDWHRFACVNHRRRQNAVACEFSPGTGINDRRKRRHL